MNAIEVLCQHIKTMVDGGFISIEEMASYLGTSSVTLRELLDGKLKPSRELAAEIEALSETFRNDPESAFAMKLAGQRRDYRPRGEVKVFPFRGK